MKQQLLALLLLTVVLSQTCPGYSGDSNKSCLGPEIDYCKTYAKPISADGTDGTHSFLCSACLDGFKLSTDKTTCSHDTYKHFTKLTTNTAMSYVTYSLAALVFDYNAIPWTQLSCVINGQIILQCMNGFVFDATTNKCVACDVTNCDACAFATKDTCTECDSGYFKSADSKTCTSCGTGAISCVSADEHTKCLDGYFLDATTKKCSACDAGILSCPTGKDKPESCNVGYYLKTVGTVKTCEACGTYDKSCTSATVATQCVDSTTTNYNYFIGGKCIQKAASLNCLTIVRNTADSDYICASCIDGFILSSGTCVSCKTFLDSPDFTKCDKVTAITAGDETTAAKATSCADGYWLNGSDLCEACTTGCKKCENDGSDAEKCTEVTSNAYYIDGLNQAIACGAASGSAGKKADGTTDVTAKPECATCTFASDAITCVTGKAIKSTYATYTAATGLFSGSKTDSFVEVASECTKMDYDADGSLRGRALAAKTVCTECTDGHSVKKVHAAQDFSDVPSAVTCEDTVTSAGFGYGCKVYHYVPTASLRGRVLATTEAAKCTACHDGFFLKTADNTCVTIADCATMLSATECSVCATGKLKTLTVTSANKCVDPIANCAEHVGKDVNSVKCTKCDEGYYMNTAQTTCTANTSGITNCKIYDDTTTKDKICWACDEGYMWVSPACVVCDTTNKCATTGCADLAYPGKGSGSTTPPAENGALLIFIMSTLFLLCSLLI